MTPDRLRARRQCAVAEWPWASAPIRNLHPRRRRRVSARVWRGVRAWWGWR